MYTFSKYDEANYFSLKLSVPVSSSLHRSTDLVSSASEPKKNPNTTAFRS